MNLATKTHWAIIAAASTLLLLLLILFDYNHPHSDDFSYNGFLMHHSYWDANALVYRYSGGRFLSTIIIFLSPLAQKNIEGYQWLTAILFILFVLSFYASFYLFFARILSRLKRFSLASLLLVLFLSFMPKLHEFAYWLCAEATYLTAATLWLWSLVLHKLLLAEQYKTKLLLWLMLHLVSIGIVGCSEVGMMLQGIPILLYWIALRAQKKAIPLAYWVNTLLFLSISALIVSSSGNVGRHELSPYAGNGWLALGGGFFSAAEQLAQWLLVALPMAFVYRILFAPSVLINAQQEYAVFPFRPKQFLIGALLYFIGMQILVVWLTGSTPEPRFQNVQFLFVLLATIVYTQISYQQSATDGKEASQTISWGTLYFICLFAALPNNFVKAALDVGMGTAKDFDQEQQKRYGLIAAQNAEIISVPPLQARPYLLYYPTLSCSPVADNKDIPRTALAEYFGKKWIYEYPCSPEMPEISIKSILKAKRAANFGERKIQENENK